jgi:capsular polysaccharide biosynthesis protein
LKAKLKYFFGEPLINSPNLDIIGPLSNRIEEKKLATVWPSSGLLRWRDGTIEIESIWIEENLHQCKDYCSLWSYFPIYMHGNYFNLSMFWHFGYYHWICDVLSRLHRLMPILSKDIKIILPPFINSWQRRSIQLIGLPINQCITYSGKRPWLVERLLYVSPVAMTGDHEEYSLKWVKDTILDRVLGAGMRPKASRKIYLARKNTWSRNLINEDELIPLLCEKGFEIVDCAQYSFDEQVKIFSEAAFVIGPHGGAMTNILWAPEGLKVFEIFEPTTIRRCYWSMCKILGYNHFCGIADSVDNKNREPNIHVNIKEIERAIDKILDNDDCKIDNVK